MPTYEHEKHLPKLPLPSVEDTVRAVEQAMAPLYTEEERHELHAKLHKFLNSESAKNLQSQLEQSEKRNPSYLDELDLDIHNTLHTKDVLPRNPFLVLESDPVKVGQMERAAFLANSALRFASACLTGDLTPDQDQTMSCYNNLFGTTRYPNGLRPSSASISSEEEEETEEDYTGMVTKFGHGKNIVVISRGQYYSITALNEDNQLLFSDKELETVIQDISKNSWDQLGPDVTAVGTMTSDSYVSWKQTRSYLLDTHKEQITTIDEALFIIVLDYTHIPEDAPSWMLPKSIFYGTSRIDSDLGFQYGSCVSRWYDKLQLIVTKDAEAAVVWDSYTCDGSAVLRFASEIYSDSILRLARMVNKNMYSLWPKVSTVGGGKGYEKIKWNFPTDFQTRIHLSETRLTDLIAKHTVDVASLPFGREFAKKIGVSADSMIQIAIQVAHYALYGKIVPTVEPVSMRRFANARSEFVPIQNMEVLSLCQSFITKDDFKLDLFVKCCHKHRAKVRKLQTHGLGGGEKHTMALNNVSYQRRFFNMMHPDARVSSADRLPEEMVHLFKEPEIIASNCGSTGMKHFGITPSSGNGFGIGYILKNDKTEISITSQYRQGGRLINTLKSILMELEILWEVDHDLHPEMVQAYRLDNAINGGYGLFSLESVASRSQSGSRPLSRTQSSLAINETKVLDSKFHINFERGLVGRKIFQ